MNEEIYRLIELVLTLIGLIFVVFGWIIPYKQSIKTNAENQKFEIEFKKIQWEKEMIDMQISKLYGPLSEIIREQNIIRSLINDQLGNKDIFDSNTHELSQLPENKQKIWKHYVETYKIPQLQKMVSIIQNNQHLIYQSEKLPESYSNFLKYALGWELLDNQKRNGVPNYYEYYFSYNYPKDFDLYIVKTLDALLAKQKELIEKK